MLKTQAFSTPTLTAQQQQKTKHVFYIGGRPSVSLFSQFDQDNSIASASPLSDVADGFIGRLAYVRVWRDARSQLDLQKTMHRGAVLAGGVGYALPVKSSSALDHTIEDVSDVNSLENELDIRLLVNATNESNERKDGDIEIR